MLSQADIIAKARVEYQRLQDAVLAKSPLSAMPKWVQSGHPPAASLLRQAGLTEVGLDEGTTRELRLARMAFTRHCGFSIPCLEAVEALVSLGPLVEVGAGTGYWSAILAAAGAGIVATDLLPEGLNSHGFSSGRYCEIEPLDAEAAVSRYPDRAVYCSWPTQNEPWAELSFRTIEPGRALALIGDQRGGITGTDALFGLPEASFTTEREIELPQFPQIRDRLVIYRRRQS